MAGSSGPLPQTPGGAAARATEIGGLPCSPIVAPGFTRSALALTVAGGIAALITATAAPALAISIRFRPRP